MVTLNKLIIHLSTKTESVQHISCLTIARAMRRNSWIRCRVPSTLFQPLPGDEGTVNRRKRMEGVTFQLDSSQWLQRDSNPQPPRCEYLSVRCITNTYSQHSSIIWSVWPNSWVFVYELDGCGFESRCSHLNFRYRACFEQGVPWHSGKYRVWIHSKIRTWHDYNMQSKVFSLQVHLSSWYLRAAAVLILFCNMVTLRSSIKLWLSWKCFASSLLSGLFLMS